MAYSRQLATVLLGVCACLPISLAATMISAEDRRIAQLSIAQAQDLCGNLEPLEVSDDAREALLAASGDNYALKAMRESKSADEFQTKLSENIDGSFVMGYVSPLVSAFLFVIGYLLCCGTSCCCRCCRKCRICARKHDPKRIFKLVAFVVLGCIVAGAFVAAVISRRGFQRASDGFKATSCTGSKLLNTTLNGVSDPYYMGVIPSMSTLDDLANSLNADSSFIVGLKNVIKDTAEIDHAVNLAAATFALARDMAAMDANVHPKKGGVDLLHESELLPKIKTASDAAITALKGGVATALQNARVEVESQLTGQPLANLQSTVTTALKPLNEMKDMFVKNFGWMVEGTTLQDFTGHLDKGGLGGTLTMVLGLLLIATVAAFALFFWTCREKNPSTDLYRPTTHRLACCSWHCGCCYMFVALFIGGFMTLLTVPMASVCMVLEDMSGALIDDISKSLEIKLEGDQGIILKDTIDKCFRNPNATANANMLDIIFTRDAATNKKETLRTSIVTNTKDAIGSKFDAITSNGGSKTLNDDKNMVELKNLFKDTSVSGMMRVPQSYNFASSPYADMAAATDLTKFSYSSASCSDFQVPASAGVAATVPGLTQFSSDLASGYGTTGTSSGCAQSVICKTGAAPACESANKFLKVKRDLRGPNIMMCITFQTATGFKCDVKNMVKSSSSSGSATYTNDCVMANGDIPTLKYACSIDEFTTMMKEFSTRLDKVLERLDTTVASSMDGINVKMKGLVDTNVLGRIDTFANGANCGFLGTAYQSFVESACYSGVLGFADISNSYVACGVLTFFLIILMFVVWRLAIDNYNSNEDQPPAGLQPVQPDAQPQAQPEEAQPEAQPAQTETQPTNEAESQDNGQVDI